jgi:hypothetical protein
MADDLPEAARAAVGTICLSPVQMRELLEDAAEQGTHRALARLRHADLRCRRCAGAPAGEAQWRGGEPLHQVQGGAGGEGQ